MLCKTDMVSLLEATNIVIQESGGRKVATIDTSTGQKAARALTDTYNEILTTTDWRFTTKRVVPTSWNNDVATFVDGFQRALRVTHLDHFGRKKEVQQTDDGLYYDGTIAPGTMPKYWAVLSETTIGVTPYPETEEEQQKYDFTLVVNPVLPTKSQDEFQLLPDRFYPALIKGAAARFIKIELQDMNTSQMFEQEYRRMIYTLQQRERSTKSTKARTWFDHLYSRA